MATGSSSSSLLLLVIDVAEDVVETSDVEGRGDADASVEDPVTAASSALASELSAFLVMSSKLFACFSL